MKNEVQIGSRNHEEIVSKLDPETENGQETEKDRLTIRGPACPGAQGGGRRRGTPLPGVMLGRKNF